MRICAVIPCYNAAPTLGRCIESVLAQTRPVDEIIVVDDGSRDGSGEIARRYGDLVRYILKPNGGVSSARNLGIEKATCEWIAFLDSDDWWAPSKIELQEKAILAAKEPTLSYTGMTVVEPDGAEGPAPAPPAEDLWPRMRFRCMITTSTVLTRRDRMLEIGGFDESLPICQDWDLWVRLEPWKGFVPVREPLTYYSVTPGSLSTDFERMLKDVEIMVEKTLLRDLSGLDRVFWRRRAMSAENWRSYLTARSWMHANPRRWLWSSLLLWPSPFFYPQRFKALLASFR